MAQLVVRNLENDVTARLQRRAWRHGRSTEAEVREILRNAVKNESTPGKPLGSRLRERFAGIGLDDELPEWRGEVARPAMSRRRLAGTGGHRQPAAKGSTCRIPRNRPKS